MFLAGLSPRGIATTEGMTILKALKDGFGVVESSIVLRIDPVSNPPYETSGDVFVTQASGLDMSLWTIGGAAVPLRLVQAANVWAQLRLQTLLTDLDSPRAFASCWYP